MSERVQVEAPPYDRSATVTGALLVMRQRMTDTENPLEVASMVADVGALALDWLGYPVSGEPEVSIRIGADEAPNKAQIILTWPLPPVESGGTT
jgi:hypothetical protein